MSKQTAGEYLEEMRKYLTEEPTDAEQGFADGTMPEPNDDLAPGDEPGEDIGDDDTIKIYFNDLTEEIQEKVIDKMKKALKVTEEDDVSINKIKDQINDNPLVEMDVEEFKRKMGLKI